jgi:hypothetical protein
MRQDYACLQTATVIHFAARGIKRYSFGKTRELKMKIRLVACLMAIGIVSGCTQTAQTVNVVDVSKSETLALTTTSSNVSGISLHVQGQLDGEAVFSAANWEPQKISGKVDFNVYHDWFATKCDLQYQPLSATTGTLTVQYTFH